MLLVERGHLGFLGGELRFQFGHQRFHGRSDGGLIDVTKQQLASKSLIVTLLPEVLPGILQTSRGPLPVKSELTPAVLQALAELG